MFVLTQRLDLKSYFGSYIEGNRGKEDILHDDTPYYLSNARKYVLSVNRKDTYVAQKMIYFMIKWRLLMALV